MIFRFVMISDEVDDFRRDIRIDATATFRDLHEAILQSVGYSSGLITSFVLCDERWRKKGEVTLIDDTTNMEDDIYLMDKTILGDLISEEGQKLKYMFDVLAERYLYLELREITLGERLSSSEVVRAKGNPPAQESDIEELLVTPVVVPPAHARSCDESSDPLEAFEEDLESEGFGDLDDLDGYTIDADF